MNRLIRTYSTGFPKTAGIIGIFIFLANFWHVIREWTANKPGEAFSGIAHYYQDFFLYSSYIAQGLHGAFPYVRNLYTNEPLPAFWYYWFYAGIGYINRYTGLSAPAAYDLSLAVIIILLITAVFLLVKHVFSDRFTSVTAFLFALTASNMPDLSGYFRSGTAQLIGETWFSPTPALNRLGGVPHQALQTLLFIAMILTVSRNTVPTRHLIVVAGISFISALINPIQTFLFVSSMGLLWAIAGIRTIQKEKHISSPFIKSFLGLCAVALPALIGALAANAHVRGLQLFTLARTWEMAQPVSLSAWEWYRSLGPIMMLVPLGILPFFSGKHHTRNLLGLYTLLTLGAFFSPIPSLTGVARFRWLNPSAHLLFPLLAANGLVWLLSAGKKYGINRNVTATVLLVLYMTLTVGAIGIQIQDRISPLRTDAVQTQLNHIPIPVRQALASLASLPDTGVVLTDPSLVYDTVVPAYTAKPSFTGHLVHTLYPATKQQLRSEFFRGGMNSEEIHFFLTNHRIAYILAPSGTLLPSAFTRVYTNADVSVYAVR